MKITC